MLRGALTISVALGCGATAAPEHGPVSSDRLEGGISARLRGHTHALPPTHSDAHKGGARTLQYDPGTYYDGIPNGLSGPQLRAALTRLISQHSVLAYNALWSAFPVTDAGAPCGQGTIDDIYSAACWQQPEQQCGSYKKEGDCFNREHTWPKSWWNGSDAIPAYTDLFHLYPADGYDNNRRANYALGRVKDDNASIIWVTTNGSKLGKCAPVPNYPGVPRTCWEPAEQHKGQLARVYFYMSTCYADTFTCCADNNGAVNGATIQPWLLATLMEWHTKFPVSTAELQRNEIIFTQYQHNRNPFVDHPEWALKVFGPDA